MSDDKSKRGTQDRKRISLEEEHEVRYWTQKFGCSKEQLEDAVRQVGPMVDDVERQLGK
jgi:hypothetical protein